jgi:hypothetical protein
MRYATHADSGRVKERLTKAFKTLRSTGMFARQNFWCCQGCATYAISKKHGEKVNYVFYHNQDNTSLLETGETYLTFGSSVKQGKLICAALRAEGLSVKWDGTIDKRIHVSMPKEN